jgi:hypothetical protein
MKSNPCTRVAVFVFGAFLCVSIAAAPTFGLAAINSATVDYTTNTLNIKGTGFGLNSHATVGSVRLNIQSSSATQIVAAFPTNSGVAFDGVNFWGADDTNKISKY